MIDKSTLLHVASIAHLRLSDQEIKEFLPQLQEVLKVFEGIQKIDTKDTPPRFHPISIPFEIRQDKPEKGLSQEEALSLTKNKKHGFFKGPKTI